MGQCSASTPQRTPGGPLVLSVVRTAAWGLGAEEDVWQVEVLGSATVKDLKAKIEELYDVPQQTQKLSLGSGTSDPALDDGWQAENLAGKRVYLNPVPLDVGFAGSPDQEEAYAGMAAALFSAAQEAQQTDQALAESLRGVTYKVHFKRPQDAGGSAAGKQITLELDALALVGDVQQMVEVEMFGAVDTEPAYLVLEGAHLPPQIPLFHAGIEEGTTVLVAKERPLSEAEQLLTLLAADGDLPTQQPAHHAATAAT